MRVNKSFVQVPEVVLKKKLSLRAVYMYAKMLMLNGKVYNRKSWVTNPISGHEEISIDALSDITKRLEKAGLIRVVPVETKKSRYKTNTYELVPLEGHYKPVGYDFLNDNLSAEAKGLAILMSLLKEIPSSNRAIGKAIGISTNTVQKYSVELELDGIYNREKKLLDEDDFPFYKQIREKRERRAHKILDEYKEWMSIVDDADKATTPYYKRTMEWVRRQKLPEEIKAVIWQKVLSGVWHLTKEDKKQIAAECETRNGDGNEITL